MPSASFNSCTMSTVKALSLSGRFKVMVPTGPSTFTATCVYALMPLPGER